MKTVENIDFDFPSWTAGLAGETVATKFLHYYKDHNLHNLKLNKNAKNLLSLLQHILPDSFSKGGFTFFDFWFSSEQSFYLSQKILVVIICDRLRFTFPWTRLDQSGPEWSRVDSPSSTVICQLPLAPPTSEEDSHSKTKPIRTRQSKQCGFSIYIFDDSKSKSMVRLVRAEKMVLSVLMINIAFMPLYM